MGGGGLHTLFTMVLGGLVGATPHMVSASVMALARLLFEFAPVLAGLVPELLPAVLMLLRSKAREVIKSVLGFVKVRGQGCWKREHCCKGSVHRGRVCARLCLFMPSASDALAAMQPANWPPNWRSAHVALSGST